MVPKIFRKSEPKAFINAKKIMNGIGYVHPWEDIEHLVEDGAVFECQADTLKDVTTIKGCYDWVSNFKASIAPDCGPDIHSIAWDEEKGVCLVFWTMVATHSGDGGPVPATNKTTRTHACYELTMNDQGKATKLTKIWNDGFCMKELGWA